MPGPTLLCLRVTLSSFQDKNTEFMVIHSNFLWTNINISKFRTTALIYIKSEYSSYFERIARLLPWRSSNKFAVCNAIAEIILNTIFINNWIYNLFVSVILIIPLILWTAIDRSLLGYMHHLRIVSILSLSMIKTDRLQFIILMRRLEQPIQIKLKLLLIVQASRYLGSVAECLRRCSLEAKDNGFEPWCEHQYWNLTNTSSWRTHNKTNYVFWIPLLANTFNSA